MSLFQRPDDVLGDPEMTREEKRALLASWASDAHAVPGLPSSRPSLHNRARIIRHRRRDDDDDPPTPPVMAAVPPQPGSGGAFAYPEPALA